MTGDAVPAPRAAHPDTEHAATLRVLLGLLADAECARHGVVSTAAQTQDMLRWYRARFDLLRRRDLERFLSDVGLDEPGLTEQMRTLSHIAIAQRVRAPDVEGRMARYQAIFRVRDWLVQRDEQAR